MITLVRWIMPMFRRAGRCSLVALTLLVAGAILMASCTSSDQIIEDITVQEAFDLIEREQDNPDFAIIDVRTPAEYADGHIENAVNIDYNSDDFEDRVGELDKDKTYVVYCRTGRRSAGALDVMKRLGFSEVYNILEGIIGWMDAGFPVV